MGKTHVLFFARNLFKNNIYQRYKKRPANLHTLPTLGNDQETSAYPVHPESRPLEDTHERERESDAMLLKQSPRLVIPAVVPFHIYRPDPT